MPWYKPEMRKAWLAGVLLTGVATFGGLWAALGQEAPRPSRTQATTQALDAKAQPGTSRARERQLSSGAATTPEFVTKLVRHEPAPQSFQHEAPPTGVREIHYPSAGRKLMAWFAYPKGHAADRVPLLVYLHGGFAFSGGEFDAVRPFLNDGFAVLTPTYRGENGNPGDFELLLGEVDDAIAALHWAADQPRIARDRIYLIGHSVGGALAGLVAVHNDPLVRASASIAGIYSEPVFDIWAKQGFVPFDPSVRAERQARLFLPQAARLGAYHIAYAPDADWTPAKAARVAKGTPKLTIQIVAGDHFSCMAPSLDAFRTRIRQGL